MACPSAPELGGPRSRRHSPGQSEISDLGIIIGIVEDIARLQVAMHDALVVRGLDTGRKRADE